VATIARGLRPPKDFRSSTRSSNASRRTRPSIDATSCATTSSTSPMKRKVTW
jgi:hypothetical protein